MMFSVGNYDTWCCANQEIQKMILDDTLLASDGPTAVALIKRGSMGVFQVLSLVSPDMLQ
jgi:hypothetical protein